MHRHHRRSRGARHLGLQVRQTDRQPQGFRGRPSGPKVNLGSIEARSVMKSWLWCVATAAALSIQTLGPIWPTLAVAGGILMLRRFFRGRR